MAGAYIGSVAWIGVRPRRQDSSLGRPDKLRAIGVFYLEKREKAAGEMTVTKERALSLGFIGAGRVGTALARALDRRGHRVLGVASRTVDSARRLAQMVPGCKSSTDPQEVAEAAGLVFITTPDEVIAQVAAQIRWHPGQIVVHCSGATSLEALQPAQEQGALVGGLHPLQSFASGQIEAGLPSP